MKTKNFLIIIFLLLVTIIVYNCAKRAIELNQKAKSLIVKMDIEECQKYAPAQYDVAKNFFDKALKYVKKKDYKKAALQFQNCISNAKTALTNTEKLKKQEIIEKESQPQLVDSETDTIIREEDKEIEDSLNQEQLIDYAGHATAKIHLIQSGESLSIISKKYYRDAKFWPIIYKANTTSIHNPDYIRPGFEIIIPPITKQAKKKEQTINDNEYIVKKGESLWQIAEKLFPESKVNLYKLIYLSNKDILTNYDFVSVGKILTIPDLSQYEYSPGDKKYMVKDGDSYWTIAQFINSVNLDTIITWQNIYELNRTEFSDSSLIYPNQLLLLP